MTFSEILLQHSLCAMLHYFMWLYAMKFSTKFCDKVVLFPYTVCHAAGAEITERFPGQTRSRFYVRQMLWNYDADALPPQRNYLFYLQQGMPDWVFLCTLFMVNK